MVSITLPAPFLCHLFKAMDMSFRSIIMGLAALFLVTSCQTVAPQYPRLRPLPGKDSAESLFLEAESHYRRQEYRQALEAYGDYLKQHPQGFQANQARLREAELLGLLGDWQGSLRKYQDLLTRSKEDETALKARYGIGRAYFKLGRYQSALGVLESLTASELPGSLRFSTNALLAEIALKKGEVESAFVRLRLASRDLPAGDQEWFDYLKNRMVEHATPADLERLANLYRDSSLTAPMLLRLARLAHEEGNPAEAARWLRILKERFPESKEAQSGEATLTGSRPVIGCLVPLSGDYAPYGTRLKQGMELGAQGGRFDLVYRDCPNDPAQTTQMVQELARNPRVLALLGPLTSADAQAAAEAAQSAGVTLVALSQKHDLTAAGPLIFQVFLTPRLQVRALLRYAMGERNLRRYALCAPDSAYGRTLARLFREELTAQGGELVSEATYPPGAQDLESALEPLRWASRSGREGASDMEALFIPDDAAAIAAILAHLEHSLGKVQVLSTNVAEPKDDLGDKARFLEGLLFTHAFFSGDPDPSVQGFISAYRQRYGAAPDYLAVQGYMAVRLMGRLLEASPQLSRAEVPQKLLALKDISGLPWFRGFAADRQAELALYLLTFRNGRVEPAAGAEGGKL